MVVEYTLVRAENKLNSKLSVVYARKLRALFPSKIAICVEIGNSAISQGINPILAISIALHETEFQNITSIPCSNALKKRLKRSPTPSELNACPQGPLQAIPYYVCPNHSAFDCNLVSAGLEAVLRFSNSISKTHGILDPYDVSYCLAFEQECGNLLAKYNRGIKGEFKKGRSEYSNYALPILETYKFILSSLEDISPTC